MSFNTTKNRWESVSFLVGTEVTLLLFTYAPLLYKILQGLPWLNYLLMAALALHLCNFAYFSWQCDPELHERVPRPFIVVHVAISAIIAIAIHVIAASI